MPDWTKAFPMSWHRIMLTQSVTSLLMLAPSLSMLAEQRQPAADAKLQQWLKKFPQADANKDGVLTDEEARAYKKLRKSGATADKPKTSTKAVVPTRANVPYGPHEHNVLDFWQARPDQATPVLVFFHGGSFKAGDKASVRMRPIFAECLNAGISIVSANYRFSSDAPFPAPMEDGARVVQFVRFKAQEWRINSARIAVSGTSAGATLALWIALHEDLADASSADPVSRLSTRVQCASPHSGTAGLEPAYFKKWAGVTKLGNAIQQLFGVSSPAELERPETAARMREASPLVHATPDDPPLFLTYAGDPSEAPFAPDSSQKDWIHHVCLGLPLKAKYEELGLECEFHYKSKPALDGEELAFLKKHLLRDRKESPLRR